MKMLSLFSVLFLVACGDTDDTVLIRVDDDGLRPLANEAAREWNACGSRQQIEISDDSDAVPLVWGSPEDLGLEENFAVTNFLGNRPVDIRVRHDHPKLQRGITHEFGHVLTGPGHWGRGIMSNPIRSEVVMPDDCHHLT